MSKDTDGFIAFLVVILDLFVITPLKALLIAWGCTKIWSWYMPTYLYTPAFGAWVGGAFLVTLLALKIPKGGLDDDLSEALARDVLFFPIAFLVILSAYICHALFL